MITDIKHRILQLVETNRVLLHDLDTSHRLLAEASRERDALHDELLGLKEELARMHEAQVPPRALERARAELAAAKQEVEARGARADRAEERLRALTAEHRALARERDELRAQLADTSRMVDEIVSSLEGDGGAGATIRPIEEALRPDIPPFTARRPTRRAPAGPASAAMRID